MISSCFSLRVTLSHCPDDKTKAHRDKYGLFPYLQLLDLNPKVVFCCFKHQVIICPHGWGSGGSQRSEEACLSTQEVFVCEYNNVRPLFGSYCVNPFLSICSSVSRVSVSH